MCAELNLTLNQEDIKVIERLVKENAQLNDYKKIVTDLAKRQFQDELQGKELVSSSHDEEGRHTFYFSVAAAGSSPKDLRGAKVSLTYDLKVNIG
jgi:vesicle coat complex subunit